MQKKTKKNIFIIVGLLLILIQANNLISGPTLEYYLSGTAESYGYIFGNVIMFILWLYLIHRGIQTKV